MYINTFLLGMTDTMTLQNRTHVHKHFVAWNDRYYDLTDY